MADAAQLLIALGRVEAEIGLGDPERVDHELASGKLPAHPAFVLLRTRGRKLLVAVDRSLGRDAAVLQPAFGSDIERKAGRDFDQRHGVVEPGIVARPRGDAVAAAAEAGPISRL